MVSIVPLTAAIVRMESHAPRKLEIVSTDVKMNGQENYVISSVRMERIYQTESVSSVRDSVKTGHPVISQPERVITDVMTTGPVNSVKNALIDFTTAIAAVYVVSV